MPDLIVAPITREVVSFGIARCQDEDRKIFPTDLELFDYANSVLRELARFSKLLKEDVFITLVPDQIEYSYVKLLDKLINVIQIETVYHIDGSGVQSLPLTYRNKKYFRNNILGDTSIVTPLYYTYDKVTIAYWRPVSDSASRLKLRVARDLVTSDEMANDVDPPEDLVAKFLPYIKYGLVKEMAMSRPDNTKLQGIAQAYDRLYNGYKEVDTIPATMDTHQHFAGEDF